MWSLGDAISVLYYTALSIFMFELLCPGFLELLVSSPLVAILLIYSPDNGHTLSFGNTATMLISRSVQLARSIPQF